MLIVRLLARVMAMGAPGLNRFAALGHQGAKLAVVPEGLQPAPGME